MYTHLYGREAASTAASTRNALKVEGRVHGVGAEIQGHCIRVTSCLALVGINMKPSKLSPTPRKYLKPAQDQSRKQTFPHEQLRVEQLIWLLWCLCVG